MKPHDSPTADLRFLAVWLAVVVAALCCLGGCALLLIAPDQMAALSPFG